MRDIAAAVGRSVSSISDEIDRNSVNRRYDPEKADRKARMRRKNAKYQGMKVVSNEKLRRFVDIHLLDDLSPEAIAGRITKHEKHLASISKNSIRRYLETSHGRWPAWHRIRQRKKQKRRGKRSTVAQLKDRTFIDKRPQYIQKRRYAGDAEADFIVSGKSGKGILLTLTDRKFRATFLEQILEIMIPNVHHAFQSIQKRFPELSSISTDNDILLQKHKELEQLLGIKIYFCHPYHSWEKGTVENTNKYIRKDIPKGSDISRYSKRFIRKLEDKLNRRFMDVLNHKTPQEMLDAYRKRKKRRSALKIRRR